MCDKEGKFISWKRWFGDLKIQKPQTSWDIFYGDPDQSNWNLICNEILRWVEILKGGQWSLALPA